MQKPLNVLGERMYKDRVDSFAWCPDPASAGKFAVVLSSGALEVGVLARSARMAAALPFTLKCKDKFSSGNWSLLRCTELTDC